MEKTSGFLDVFRTAALQAGAVARRMQNRVEREMKKGEGSPEAAALTSADLAAQDVILYAIHHFFPQAAMDAEEDTGTVSLFSDPGAGAPLIVVDPIDGTLNYSNGSLDYAVMGGILEHGFYQESLIYFPAKEEMYWAESGGGCWRTRGEGTQPHRVRIGLLPDRTMVTPNVPDEWRHKIAGMGMGVSVSRCSAVDSSAPVTGRAAVSVSVDRPDRRRSLGYLLVLEAGGAVFLGEREWQGEDPLEMSDFKGPTVVASSRKLAKEVVQTLMVP